jgi:hypothetical protein
MTIGEERERKTDPVGLGHSTAVPAESATRLERKHAATGRRRPEEKGDGEGRG